MKRSILALLCVITAVSSLNATEADNATISGKVTNADTISVELRQYSDYPEARNFPAFTSTKKVYSAGHFDISTSNISKPTFIQLVIRVKDKVIHAQEYIIEPGDSIYMIMSGADITFTGRGKNTFLCLYEMGTVQDNLHGLVRAKNGLAPDPNYYADKMIASRIYDSLYQRKIKILLSHKKKLNPEVFQMIMANCISQREYLSYDAVIFDMTFKKDSATVAQIVEFYRDHLLHQNSIQPGNCYNSFFFISKLLSKAKLDVAMQINEYGVWKRKPRTEELYHYLDSRYTGAVRERMLTALFVALFNTKDSSTFYIKECIKGFRNPEYKKVLETVLRHAPGVPFFDFTLPDSSNIKHSLSDYKGKVIVLKFWYTGCVFCLGWSEQLKPIEAKYENYPTVKFINISIDEDVNKWKKSLRSGLYTYKTSLDLYTEGRSSRHPLIEYYGIQGYPYVVILDKEGRIVVINPDPPYNDANKSKIVAYIENALK